MPRCESVEKATSDSASRSSAPLPVVARRQAAAAIANAAWWAQAMSQAGSTWFTGRAGLPPPVIAGNPVAQFTV